MSVQFILGGSGSGKSTYIFKKIVERSEAEEDRNFFILVPDQFTMQTQMDMVSMHPRNGIMNIDVLSFSRLSYRILEETGGNKEAVLDDTGKSLVLRKVVGKMEEQLPVLGNNLRKLGYINEVKSAISEFMQYDVGEEEIEQMLLISKKRGGLHGKLKDLGLIYQNFKEYLQEKYITTEETYDRLAKQLEKSKLIKNSIVVLDGFTGFTPIQNKVLRKIFRYAAEVYITITIDQESGKEKKISENHLFSLSNKTLASLYQIAELEKVAVLEPVWMKQKTNRFEEREDLIYLERNLFRYPTRGYQKNPEHIHLLSADSMEDEVRQACRKIRELLKKGYAYREIAVITGELPEYAGMVEEVFSSYQIPFFLDETKAITLNPFIEYIRAAISVLVKQFSYESVFHYLRSGMVDFKREEIDALEQYCIAYGIKGKKAWSSVFVRGNLEREEMERLNQLRSKLMEDFSVFQTGKQKAEKQIYQLYEFLRKNKCEEKLRKFEKYFADQKDKSKEKEYHQIYLLVMQLLEQIFLLLGDEKLSWEEMGQIIDAGFGEIQVGLIPQCIDQVLVGDMERTRLKQVKALFFLGMNEGKIPRTSSKGGILSDIDREFLADAKLELSPTPRQKLFIQKFYFYLMVTKPSHYLFLSYANLNKEGKTCKPSYFIDQLKKIFPALEEEKGIGIGEPYTFEEARKSVALLLPRIKKEKMEEEKEEYLYALTSLLKEKNTSWWEEICDAAFFQYEPEVISKEAANTLYGAVIYSSVSRLEKMAACAFAHHLEYGLGLKERQEYRFEAVDLGNVLHGVLEIFAGKLAENNYTWLNFPKEEGKEILKAALEAYAISYGDTILFSTARNAYGLEKIERILWRTVRTLQYQLQKGKFLPKSFELSFSALEDLDSVTIRLGEKEKLRLGGRIDRVDTYEEKDHIYVKVMDYKSGNQKFQLAALYHGLQLQLVMYLNVAMELEQKKYPKAAVHPGAFLYYHVTDPMVEIKEELEEEEIEQLIRQELRANGRFNEKEEVRIGLDHTHETKSDVVYLEYKKDGSISSRSQAIPEEQMILMQKYAREKAGELGKRMASGEIQKNPILLKDRDACTFCSFKHICGFDERLPGYKKVQPEELEEEEILEKMRIYIEEKEGGKKNEVYSQPAEGN